MNITHNGKTYLVRTERDVMVLCLALNPPTATNPWPWATVIKLAATAAGFIL